jgi:hypothetical protein
MIVSGWTIASASHALGNKSIKTNEYQPIKNTSLKGCNEKTCEAPIHELD